MSGIGVHQGHDLIIPVVAEAQELHTRLRQCFLPALIKLRILLGGHPCQQALATIQRSGSNHIAAQRNALVQRGHGNAFHRRNGEGGLGSTGTGEAQHKPGTRTGTAFQLVIALFHFGNPVVPGAVTDQPGRAVCKQTVAELIRGISTYTVNPAGCRARIEERPNRAVAVNHVGRITEQHGCCRLAATASNPVVARRANLPDLFQVERRAGGFNHRQEGVYTT